MSDRCRSVERQLPVEPRIAAASSVPTSPGYKDPPAPGKDKGRSAWQLGPSGWPVSSGGLTAAEAGTGLAVAGRF